MSIQLPKAILFDMDNTILANDSTSPRSWELAFARFASRLGGLGVQAFVGTMNEIRPRMQGDPVWDQWARFNVAASRRELVALAFSRLGVNAGETADEVANAYAETREASTRGIPRRNWYTETYSGDGEKDGADHQRPLQYSARQD